MKQKEEMKSIFYNLKRSWKYIKEGKGKLFTCLVLSLFLCLISLVTPLLSAKLLLNLTGNLMNELMILAFFIMIVEFTRNFCQFFYNQTFSKYWLSGVSELQKKIASETLNLKIKEIDKKSSGVFIDRLNNDTREIVTIFTEFGDAIIDVLTNIGVLVAILFINKYFFLYYLITCTILFIIERKRMTKQFEIDKKRRKLYEKNTGLIGELVRGVRDIKILNAHSSFMNTTYNKLLEANKENFKMEKVGHQYRLLTWTLRDIFAFGMLFLGAYLVSLEMLTVASFLIVYMYKDNVQGLLRYFSFVIELLKKFNIAANRVFEVVEDNTFEKEKFGSKVIEKVNGDFEFKDVHFAYNEESEILKGVNFKVHANETVAFVGKSGSGKSTIFSLIDKLYDVDNGKIFIDGIDINELTRDSIRDNISVISQNPYIFNFSIRDNLKLVKENLTDDEMKEACKIACLDSFIEGLEDGYDTLVGEGGLTLSGGQRQRLAIARALLKKTEIILFDEATSALDNETQKEIQKAISNMKGEYTILIIAHRLSTVINSDRILLLDDGKIIGEGSHKELLKNNEIYKNLYDKELV
jgi:ABC-type multidrug transport system, ATPase and permease components